MIGTSNFFIPKDFPAELTFKILHYADPKAIESILITPELSHLHQFICIVIEKLNIIESGSLLKKMLLVENDSRPVLLEFMKSLEDDKAIVTGTGATVVYLDFKSGEGSVNLSKDDCYHVLKNKVNLFITSNDLDIRVLSDILAFKFNCFEYLNIDVDLIDVLRFYKLYNEYFSGANFQRLGSGCTVKLDDRYHLFASWYSLFQNRFLSRGVDDSLTLQILLGSSFPNAIASNNLNETDYTLDNYVARFSIFVVLVLKTRIKIKYHMTFTGIQPSYIHNQGFEKLSLQQFNIDASLMYIEFNNPLFNIFELSECSINNNGIKMSSLIRSADGAEESKVEKVSVYHPKLYQVVGSVDISQIIDLQGVTESAKFVFNPDIKYDSIESTPKVFKLNNFHHASLKSLSLTNITQFQKISLPRLRHLRLVYNQVDKSDSVLSMKDVNCPEVKYFEIINSSPSPLSVETCVIGSKNHDTGSVTVCISDSVPFQSLLKDNMHLVNQASNVSLTIFGNDSNYETFEEFCFPKAMNVTVTFKAELLERIFDMANSMFPNMEEFDVFQEAPSNSSFTDNYSKYLHKLTVKSLKWL